MQNSLLYAITVLIWGSTWLAIKFQLGIVSPELSVAYRFLFASLLIFIYSYWKGLTLKFSAREHVFIALQGLLLFSTNYVLVYFAEQHVTSGLVAVIFSTIIILNVLFGSLFLKSPVRLRVVLGALVGISGLALIFRPELAGFSVSGGAALGLGLAVISSVSASLGNIVSARNQREKLPVIQTNAFGMAYGAAFTLLVAFGRGVELSFDPSFSYVASLAYLALFGSVIAFGSYLTLLGRIGADRAAYITIVFPVIALLLSAVFEGLILDVSQLMGVALVLAGNVIVLQRKRKLENH
ncbi:MAG: EamA family transporter [Chloroflexi bacterium]|nr:EamA family transporter [Chloroflexota bacterium]MQC27310.1 EamA family transporter [Chloroflexota bacterium]